MAFPKMALQIATALILAFAFESRASFADGSSNAASTLSTYEIVPFFHISKTVAGNPVKTWQALKVDRKKNDVELCTANLGAPGDKKLFAVCSPLKNDGAVPNFTVSSVATLPGPLANSPGLQEIWAIDINTGQVTFCYGTCVVANERQTPAK